MAPARFGAYSIYQSVLEAALVVGTLGSCAAVLAACDRTGPRPSSAATLVRTLAIGLPIALLLALGMLTLQRVPASATALVLVAATPRRLLVQQPASGLQPRCSLHPGWCFPA